MRSRIESLIDVHVRKAWLDVWFGPMRHILLHVAPDKLQDTIKFNHLAKKYSDDRLILADNGAGLSKEIQLLWESGDKVQNAYRTYKRFFVRHSFTAWLATEENDVIFQDRLGFKLTNGRIKRERLTQRRVFLS